MIRAAILFCVSTGLLLAGPAREAIRQAEELERSGEITRARSVLAQAAESSPANAEALLAYAEFLERRGDPSCREAYEKALTAGSTTLSPQDRRGVSRRLALLALSQGDQQASRQFVDIYRELGGADLDLADQVLDPATLDQVGMSWAQIPGPLFSFRRMAALSSDQEPDELLPALARNIVTGGYRATRGAESLERTEYLKLVLQYLSQARELLQFAGADGTIDIPECESNETAQLLKILGFRLRNECGPEAVLETVNPSRAFLSIDSGFPLASLELAYREGKPFHLPYQITQLPVLFDAEYWKAVRGKKATGDFVEDLLSDPAMARLYVAITKIHQPTAQALREKIAPERLKNFAHVLDFFGGSFEIRNGKARVPGAPRTEQAWERLVGVSVNEGPEFFQRLAELDDGWMASYFDSLMRARGAARQAYFFDPARLERFYMAVRGKVTSPGPARPIFRANSELMLLISRLHFNPDGSPHIPGGVAPWVDLFVEHPHGKYDGKLTKSAKGWKEADDVVEAMFALCRKAVENEPLQMFMTITNINRSRKTPLQEQTVRRLLLDYPDYGGQFSLFNDAPGLSDVTIVASLNTLAGFDKMGNRVRRADAVGTFQALVSLWHSFLLQGHIPEDRVDSSLRELIAPFAGLKGDEELFNVGRAGVRVLLAATGTPEEVSPQERLIELLAGEPGPNDQAAHEEVVEKLTSHFASQRLVSIKDLFDLADHLERVSRGESFNVAMANRLAARISEVRLPRSNLSSAESNAFAQGHWVEKHIQAQRSLNLRRLVDRAEGRPDRLLEIRGKLAPILRDSLVGLSYVAYSPPGAQLIRANPLFVRSHDFLGSQGTRTWRPARLLGTGWPSSGGGRLVGSLIGLPYALAEAEQNFMIPSKRQALIWQDLAPQILLGATVPRWWSVNPADQHFVGLHLRLGKKLLTAAAVDSSVQKPVFDLLERRVEPARLWRLSNYFQNGEIEQGIDEVTPAELYELAERFLDQHRSMTTDFGEPFAFEILRLQEEHPERFNQQRVASLFGVPHPELSDSYRLELLNLPLFPTMMGFSSRILAESWESTNLYWAALADELHLSPAQLNLLVPEWTRKSLERIFATHLDDWPALLRSMRIVADSYRQQFRPRIQQQVRAGWNQNSQQLE